MRKSKLSTIKEQAMKNLETQAVSEQDDVLQQETPEYQRDVLADDKASTHSVLLMDGSRIDLPNELTMRDVLKRKTFEQITSFIFTVHYWANKLDGNPGNHMPTAHSLPLALLESVVKEKAESFLSSLLEITKEKLEANITQDGIGNLYFWAVSQVLQEAEARKASQAKK